jgi:hypothetical protein
LPQNLNQACSQQQQLQVIGRLPFKTFQEVCAKAILLRPNCSQKLVSRHAVNVLQLERE